MMNKIILKSCAEDLKGIRSQLPIDLEPGVNALFDSVILRLELSEEVVDDPDASDALIKDAMHMAMMIAEIISRFWS